MTSDHEYLVSHGKSGAFGRFTGAGECQRGDRVIVRGPRGLEMGTVLCLATERQQRMLGHLAVGQILRRADVADEQRAKCDRELAQRLVDLARQRAREAAMTLEILDGEILFDRGHAVLQCLAPATFDFNRLFGALENEFRIIIAVENLAVVAPVAEEEHGGCGKPGCGHADGGGCSSCGSGGGCSSCGGSKVDLRDYFAHLRGKMEERHQRTSLNVAR